MATRKGANTGLNTSATNTFNKGMVKDYTEIFVSEGLWTHAINAINNSHYGETGSIGNEPSNTFCAEAPYDIIGYAHKTKTEWVIFSTNNISSEIGIFDESDCSYTALINDSCLSFNRTNLITAVVNENYDCTWSVYWQDNLNPDRVMNLDNIPYLCEPAEDPCDDDVCTDRLDCDAIRLHPLVQQPCVKISKSQGAGQLINGSYMAAIAYSENGVRLTDYSMPSNIQSLWRHDAQGSGLDITISDLDPNFEEYELVIIAFVAQQTIVKKINNYSTNQTTVTIDLIPLSNETIPTALLPLKNVVYERSEGMFEVNNYLIRTSVTTQLQFNYQPLANQINTNWVAVKYPKDYYWDGGNLLGYYRDEVYAFFIRWVYKTGARSASYHIPGRAPTADDVAPVTTSDVVYPTETEFWQVYDTSTKVLASGAEQDGGEIVAKGQMAYWESTEKYPTKPTIWGDLCNEPIRHHKMPSNDQIHIHDQGGNQIIVLGVDFSNIQHPLDNDGVPIEDIVGYEILRGTREGNRSIIAKGLIGNMIEFPIEKIENRKGLFANYPWNDLRPDPFLTPDYSVLGIDEGDEVSVDDTERLDTYKKDYLSFHSVEGSFLGTSLGATYLQLYNEQFGTATGQFEIPYRHPKFKLITDGAFGVGTLVAVGLAVIESIGTTTAGPSGVDAEISIPFFGAVTSSNRWQKESGSASSIGDAIAYLTSSITAGSVGAIAATTAAIASFVLSVSYYMTKTTDQVLSIMRNASAWRDYYLQYNGHGFYSRYGSIPNAEVPFGTPTCVRRNIINARYIGSHLQDFDSTYRINNLYRPKYICINTDGDIPDPQTIDNSKKRVRDMPGVTGEEVGQNYKDPTAFEFVSTISGHYGALKRDFQNQYGALDSVSQIPTNSCIYNTEPEIGVTYNTNTIFGGDVYINRFTEKNPYFFFNTWLYDFVDGTEIDYTKYVNGPAPIYYARLQNFDLADFNISVDLNLFNSDPVDIDITTPSDFFRFDEPPGFAQGLGVISKTGVFIKKNAWAYLFYNGIKDFYTESELNMAFRDYGEQSDSEKFYDVYGYSFNDLSTIFRSDIINKPSFYKYDLSLSASRVPITFSKWGSVLPRDYDPDVYETCFQYYPNRAIYSLQQQSGLKRDNWRNYLPLNFKDFDGKIAVIKSLNATGAIILFENNEPLLFTGVDQLQVKGGSTKLTIGDSGLFANNFQAVVNADDALEYGSSISTRSAINTPFGLFYISQKQGKIFTMGGSSLEEISRAGMKFWFSEHLPSKLLEVYPDYPLYDNPVAGIGCQAIYDPTYELVYFTKRDYKPLRTDLLFDNANGVPYYYCGLGTVDTDPNNIPAAVGTGVTADLQISKNKADFGEPIELTWTTTNATSVDLRVNDDIISAPLDGSLTVVAKANTDYWIEASDGMGNTAVDSKVLAVEPPKLTCPCPFDDPTCFEPCDWTVSYDPKSKLWISFHDWHPSLFLPSYRNFHTIKGNEIWKHNDSWESYCNYYGDDYPWEIEFPVSTPNNVTTLRNVEYTLDVYKFYNDGNDYFHILDENFDRAIIYNSEQISGLLRLTIKGKNSPLDLIEKPVYNGTSIDIKYSKEENKFRFNQFWDITNDRGEFTGTQLPMWITKCSGYERHINPDYVDYNKPELQHKKIRHYGNKVILRKNISNDKKMILKLLNTKQNLSPR